MGKTSKDKRDIFYRQAKEEGWRARSAYKLLHLNEYYLIFDGVQRAVDLCAAPGSWSQVLAKALFHPQHLDEASASDVKIVAVDLQQMAPIPGVVQIQGDITRIETAQKIISHFEGKKADLVVCDGAPDVTGMHDMDSFVQGQLLLGALHIAANVLVKGGTFVTKIFRSKELRVLASRINMLFENVIICKPPSSRNCSLESFIVAKKYNPPVGFEPEKMTPFLDMNNHDWKSLDPINGFIIPFLMRGSEENYDADSAYKLEIDQNRYEYLEPASRPIDPPYRSASIHSQKSRTNTVTYDNTMNRNAVRNQLFNRIIDALEPDDGQSSHAEDDVIDIIKRTGAVDLNIKEQHSLKAKEKPGNSCSDRISKLKEEAAAACVEDDTYDGFLSNHMSYLNRNGLPTKGTATVPLEEYVEQFRLDQSNCKHEEEHSHSPDTYLGVLSKKMNDY